MRTRTRLRLLLVGAAAATLALAAGPAQAYRLGGQRWTKRTITVKTPSRYRAPVADAIRAWNTSGVRVRFRMVTAGRGDITVGSLPVKTGAACGKSYRLRGKPIAGLASIGAQRGAFIKLDPNCDRFELVFVATHELGHNLGLLHDDRKCALMAADPSPKCPYVNATQTLPWEYVCRPLYADDVAGAIRRYGGTMRPIPADHVCLRAPVPAPAGAPIVQIAPSDTLAATRISWNNPADANLQRVSVTRRSGECANHPILDTAYRIRGGVPDLMGDFSVVVAATPGAAQSVTEANPPTGGTVCYSVWTIGADNRWRHGASTTVTHPGPIPGAQRIAMTVTKLGTGARIAWSNPSSPSVLTHAWTWAGRYNGACPTDIGAPRTKAFIPPTAPGAVSFTDTTAISGAVCYRVALYDGVNPQVVAEIQL